MKRSSSSTCRLVLAKDLRHGDEMIHANGQVTVCHGSPVAFGNDEVGIYFRSGPAVVRRCTDRVNVVKR